jgi:hypothetical protein
MARIVLIAVLTITLAELSRATQLIFQPVTGTFGNFSELPAGYGDRVSATSQDGFLYDLDGGQTPNIVTEFGITDQLVRIYTWGEQYGDLHNIIFAQEPQPFEFRLVADPGSKVVLNSFDMAGWPNLDFPSIASVTVENGSGNVLFSQTNVLIHGDVSGLQHTHFSFTGVSANELRIKFDSTTDGHGNVLDSDDVGLDNINFSQTVGGSLTGDYNNNGIVDAADYAAWRDNQDTTHVLPNDPLGGTIGVAQYNQWRSHFGQTAGSGAGDVATLPVPESTTLGLMTFAATVCCFRRGRAA